MSLLTNLRKLAHTLEHDTGITLSSDSSITVIEEDGKRIDIPRELLTRLFGSVESVTALKPYITGCSLEVSAIKIADDVWMLLEEIFESVDEV